MTSADLKSWRTERRPNKEREMYTIIKTYPDGTDGPVMGYMKQYADGRWGFKPAVRTGKKATGKRFAKYDDAIPKWAGGVDGTRAETYTA